MHSKGIMHRDLKPKNIMFKGKNSTENLKIVDFGLATNCKLEKFLFPKCGSPGYAAPEIVNLSDNIYRYDKIGDIFSVGSIFYKL